MCIIAFIIDVLLLGLCYGTSITAVDHIITSTPNKLFASLNIDIFPYENTFSVNVLLRVDLLEEQKLRAMLLARVPT